VYRAEEAAPPPHPIEEPPGQVKAAETRVSEDNPVLMVGKGFFLIGLGTLEIAAWTARGLIFVPMRFAKRMLIPD
jgi:hypothetical protein